MSGVQEVGMAKDQRAERAAGGKREVRWSVRRKEEVVLRLLRGEPLDLHARETGQPAGRIASWRESFLAAGREGLRARPRPVEDRELAEAQRKIGELAMDNDILRALLEEKGRPLTEALSVSSDWMPRWPGSAGSRGCPGRRRASSVADAAPRLPLDAGRGRWDA